ncbi:MAG: biotin/lipoyl-containing protein [Gemmatimonadaceae bacterium]|nr:biotin/lipoyl-containing protein [Gemmatimonadaceae bacterium]
MIAIKVPPLGESIVEATVSRWLKQEGDAVAAGETLVELETDKITVEVPALKAGVLASRARAEGDVVAVDDVLGQLDESGSARVAGAVGLTDPPPGDPINPPVGPPVGAVAAYRWRRPPPGDPINPPVGPPVGAVAASAGDPPPTATPSNPPVGPPVGGGDPATVRPPPGDPLNPPVGPPVGAVANNPAARRTADAAGVDITTVTGTGRGGVVSKPDVVTAIGCQRCAARRRAGRRGSVAEARCARADPRVARHARR